MVVLTKIYYPISLFYAVGNFIITSISLRMAIYKKSFPTFVVYGYSEP